MQKRIFYFVLILLLIAGDISLAQTQRASYLAAVDDTARYFTFGGTKTEEFRDVALTSDSGFILVGTTNGYGQGNSSIYVCRANKKGKHLWSSVLGGSNIDKGYSVISLSGDHSLVAGSSNSYGVNGYDGYLCKLSDQGMVIWQKTIGGTDWDFIYDMLLLPDSSIIVCGETYSNSIGGSDAWVLRLDTQGNILWQKNLGGFGDDAFKGISFLGQSIYLCGHRQNSDLDGYLVRLDLSGQLIFEKSFNFFGEDYFNAITNTNSNELIMCGGSIHTDSVKNEFWIQQCDSNGNPGMALHGISIEDDYLNSILVRSNSDILVTGMKDPGGFGQKSMLTIQYDSIGGNFRAHTFGGPLDEEAYKIIERPEGGMALSGYTNSYGAGNWDALLLLLDTNEILPLYEYSVQKFYETLSPIGIDENSFTTLGHRLYPNPAQNFITIRSAGPADQFSIKLFSIDGSLQLEQSTQGGDKIELDISFLSLGIYLLEIQDRNGIRQTEKFFKM